MARTFSDNFSPTKPFLCCMYITCSQGRPTYVRTTSVTRWSSWHSTENLWANTLRLELNRVWNSLGYTLSLESTCLLKDNYILTLAISRLSPKTQTASYYSAQHLKTFLLQLQTNCSEWMMQCNCLDPLWIAMRKVLYYERVAKKQKMIRSICQALLHQQKWKTDR